MVIIMRNEITDKTWEIRDAVIADYDDIFTLQLKAYHTENLLYDYTIPPMLQSREEAVQDCCLASLVLVAVTEKGEIVGSVRGSLDNETCTINKLMVDPAWRNRGIGACLLREIENRLKAEKYRLFTGTKSCRNILMYEKHGYIKVAEDTEKELIFMEKKHINNNKERRDET